MAALPIFTSRAMKYFGQTSILFIFFVWTSSIVKVYPFGLPGSKHGGQICSVPTFVNRRENKLKNSIAIISYSIFATTIRKSYALDIDAAMKGFTKLDSSYEMKTNVTLPIKSVKNDEESRKQTLTQFLNTPGVKQADPMTHGF